MIHLLSNHPGSRRPLTLARLVVAFLLIVLFGAIPSESWIGDAHAADVRPAPERSYAEHPVLRDTRLVLKARQALYEDPLLAPYNLGVQLHGDVATLTGTLPDAALAQRATERVRNLGLFKEVRNELMIDAACGIGQSTDSAPLPAQKFPVAEANPGTKPATTRPLSDAVTLLPPRPIAPPKKTPTEGVAVISPPRPIPAKDPAEAIEQLRRSEARYSPLQVSVREGIVTVRGNAHGEDMYAFAQAVRALPGVVRVVLGPAP